jgi:hypothetical protein
VKEDALKALEGGMQMLPKNAKSPAPVKFYGEVAKQLWESVKAQGPGTPEYDDVMFFIQNGYLRSEQRPKLALPSPADFQSYVSSLAHES